MEGTRGSGTSQNNSTLAPLPRGLWLFSGLPAPTDGHPVSLHSGVSAGTCMACPNRDVDFAGETFLSGFPPAPSPVSAAARYGSIYGHQFPPAHDRLAKHSGGGNEISMARFKGAGIFGDDFSAKGAAADGRLGWQPLLPGGEKVPEGRMRGPKFTTNKSRAGLRRRPLIASLRSGLLPGGKKRECLTSPSLRHQG